MTLLTLELDQTLSDDFLGLAQHIGIDPQTALIDAITTWIGQNAPTFEYEYGTDRTDPDQENK